jgi:hypothetical protein
MTNVIQMTLNLYLTVWVFLYGVVKCSLVTGCTLYSNKAFFYFISVKRESMLNYFLTTDGYFADYCPHSRCHFAPAHLLSAKHLHNARGPAVYLIAVPQSSLFAIILTKTTHKRNWREMSFCKWGENERHFKVGEGKKSLTLLDNFSANLTIMIYKCHRSLKMK